MQILPIALGVGQRRREMTTNPDAFLESPAPAETSSCRLAGQQARALMKRLRVEDLGQDLVEYALLTAFVGLGVLAGFTAIQNSLTGSYGTWDTQTQALGAVTPDPMGGGS